MWGIRVIIPKSLQASLLKDIHQGHPGISKMKSLARSHFWWPGLDSDLEHLAKSCQSCQAVKQAPPAAHLQPWTWPAKPWERVHIDFAGPFLSKMFLVATDAHSKWNSIYHSRYYRLCCRKQSKYEWCCKSHIQNSIGKLFLR